ncbi:MAG: alpha-1,2-fucosyltransferase [Ferruginibacter sp.]
MKFRRVEAEKMVLVKMHGGWVTRCFVCCSKSPRFVLSPAEAGCILLQSGCHQKPREWSLDVFKNIEEEIAGSNDIHSIIPVFSNQVLERAYRFALKKMGWINKRYVIEKAFLYAPLAFTGSEIYLDGYWQSYKHFAGNDDLVRQAFDLSNLEKNLSLQPMINEIRQTTSVSLHVRRGDYITNLRTNKFNGVCSPGYYYKAIAYIRQAVNEKLKIFIFSDDIEWCKKNMAAVNDDHIFVNKGKDASDLYLMSICRHNIIANSTFSWWAAWLNTNQQKIVVAPKRWHSGLKGDTDDLLPGEWIKMDESVT